MPTLLAYREEMFVRSRHEVGRTVTPSAFAAQTVTVPALATGTIGAAKFANKYLIRPTAATAAGADRVRMTTDTGFVSSTGVLTHAGTAYVDTTVGSEQVEITEYEPLLYDDSIQQTLMSLNRSDRTEFPTRNGLTRYWLTDLTWVTEPRDVLRVTFRNTPVVSRNRAFEKWNTVLTTGILQADWWTVSGSAATYARSQTQVRTGLYSAAITRSGTDCLLTQAVGLLDTGIVATGGSGNLIGQSVQPVAAVWSAVASQIRTWVSFDGGATKTYSTYHTGGSGWEEVSAANTVVPATATNVTFGVSVEGSNTVCYVDDCYLALSGTNDSVRRDDYPEQDITQYVKYPESTGSLLAEVPAYGWAGQIIFYSMRPYPGFDPTRLLAGTADSDVQDAPLATVACGALWRLYDGLTGKEAEARRWRAEYEALARPQLKDDGDGRAGLPLPPMLMAGGRRF